MPLTLGTKQHML